MAVTKLMNIKSSPRGRGRHLYNSIRYIINPEKTKDGLLVGGNAGNEADEIYNVMIGTKRDWDKSDGRQGYHFVLSWKPGEIDEDRAYELVKEFCEEYLGEAYDYVFSIHDDHDHVHGHIVFNSVSRTTGYKYRYEKGDWEKYIQPVTDRICERHGLSRLEYEKEKRVGKSYAEHYAEKKGRYTWKKIIRSDIDYMISCSESWQDFLSQMKQIGYTFPRTGVKKDIGEYITFCAPGGHRRRSDSLGIGYTVSDIKKRLTGEMTLEKILSKYSRIVSPEIKRYSMGNFTKQTQYLSPYQSKYVSRYLQPRTYYSWIMFAAWYLNYYRNTHFGAENGTEQWADIKKINKMFCDKRDEEVTYLSKNVAVANSRVSNQNVLVIGGSGTYKTTSVVIPNLFAAVFSNVFLDIKGDLLRKYGKYLEHQGVTVKVLNFINMEESDRWNPFKYIEKETDLIKLITNMQTAVKPPDAMKGDPFWDDGVGLYLQSMFYYEWMRAKEENRYGSMNNIMELVNMESKKVDEEGTTALQAEMDRLAQQKGKDYPPVRDYRKLKEGATETVRSIIIMVNAMLRLLEVPSLKRILEDDDIDIKSLGLGIEGNPQKRTALFLVLPDNDESFNFLISMFYTQLFDVLIRTADFECGGALPIHVRLWADEYYAGPKPLNAEKLMGTIRSRNLSIVPILQSFAQIKTLFPQDKWEIFLDNCATVIYLGTGPASYSTHEYISKLLGEMTIDKRTDGTSTGHSGNASINNDRMGRTLMTPAEVKRMPRKDCIIFIEGQYPIYDQKNLLFNTKIWKEAEILAGETGYKHPVKVIYDEESMSYRTIRQNSPIIFLDKEEVEFYKSAQKSNDSIKVFEMSEEEFLYLNWRAQPPMSEDEIAAIFKEAEKQLDKERIGEEPYGNVSAEKEVESKNKRGKISREELNLSGSIFDCIKRYAEQMDKNQMDELLKGLEAGLSEKQVKSYFGLPADEMGRYRKAYMFANTGK